MSETFDIEELRRDHPETYSALLTTVSAFWERTGDRTTVRDATYTLEFRINGAEVQFSDFMVKLVQEYDWQVRSTARQLLDDRCDEVTEAAHDLADQLRRLGRERLGEADYNRQVKEAAKDLLDARCAELASVVDELAGSVRREAERRIDDELVEWRLTPAERDACLAGLRHLEGTLAQDATPTPEVLALWGRTRALSPDALHALFCRFNPGGAEGAR